MSDLTLRFLTRSGCHLCDLARPMVESAAARANATLLELDVDADDVLHDRYGSRIPVLLGPEDVVIAEGPINDARMLRRDIRRVARSMK